VTRERWTTAEPFDTLVERLLLNRRTFVHTLDFVFHGLGWHNPITWDCDLYFNLPSSLFGGTPGTRPGDIDVLLIPRIGPKRLIDQTVAIEVKSFRVRQKRRGKSPSDFGSGQARGLARLGFPYVGLLHLAVLEAGAEDEHALLPVWPTDTPMATNSPPTEWVNMDLSNATHFFRHNPRMNALDVPEEVGLKLFSTSEHGDGYLWGHTVGYERPVKTNRESRPRVIDHINSLVRAYPAIRVGYTRPRFRVTRATPSQKAVHNG